MRATTRGVEHRVLLCRAERAIRFFFHWQMMKYQNVIKACHEVNPRAIWMEISIPEHAYDTIEHRAAVSMKTATDNVVLCKAKNRQGWAVRYMVMVCE